MAASKKKAIPETPGLQDGEKWIEKMKSMAEAGLEKATPAEATALLADLLRHPANSSPRKPKRAENTLWFTMTAIAQSDAFSKLGEKPQRGGNGSPYPKNAVAPRIRALVARGANLAESGALFRAVCRESEEECAVILALPGAPGPGAESSAGSSCLHRAAYNGPTPLFNMLAEKAKSDDWIARDKDGRYPLGKAIAMRSLQRSLACAAQTPLDKMLPDNEGDTLLMQIVKAFSFKRGFGLGKGKWRALFEQILSQGDPKKANAAGETPLMVAARFANLEMVRALLPRSDLLAKNNEGRSALFESLGGWSSDERMGVIAALTPGSDLTLVDAKGENALFCAARANFASAPLAIDRLISLMENPQAKNLAGETAVDVAMKLELWGNVGAMASIMTAQQLEEAMKKHISHWSFTQGDQVRFHAAHEALALREAAFGAQSEDGALSDSAISAVARKPRSL